MGSLSCSSSDLHTLLGHKSLLGSQQEPAGKGRLEGCVVGIRLGICSYSVLSRSVFCPIHYRHCCGTSMCAAHLSVGDLRVAATCGVYIPGAILACLMAPREHSQGEVKCRAYCSICPSLLEKK